MKRSGLKRTKGLAQGKGLERRSTLRGGAGWQKDVAPPPPGSRPDGLPPKPGLSRKTGLASVGKKKRAAPPPSPERAARTQRLREAWMRDIVAEFSDERGIPHCAVCDRTPRQLTASDHRGRKLHGHHVIPQQRLERIARTRGLPEEYLLWDGRGGLLLCVECHWNHEHGVRRIPHRALTYSNLTFASDLGEEVYVERTYPLRPDHGHGT